MLITTAVAQEPLTKDDVNTLIKQYINNNPQIIYDALMTHHKNEMAKQEQEAKSSIIKNYDLLFKDSATPYIGNPNAKYQVVEFMDYECGHCKTMGPRLQELAQKGQTKVIIKHLPIRGKNSLYSSELAIASMKQGKFAQVHEALLNAKDISTPAKIDAVLISAGLDLPKAKKDVASTKSEIDQNFRLAAQLKIQGTPTMIFSKGTPDATVFVPGAVSNESIQGIIKQLDHS